VADSGCYRMPYSDELDFAPLGYILAALNIGEKDEKHLKK